MPEVLTMHDGLAILWFLLISVLLLGYFILDGFDLGAGVLSPFVAKNENERALVRRAIGPVWDGNEVWLLTAGGALFAAFAPAYATSFSGFYLAIMLVLFGLIFRAVAVEYADRDDTKFKGFWNGAFFVGSFLPALLLGCAIGNVIEGVALVGAGDTAYIAQGFAIGDYVGGFFALLNPFGLLCGVLGLTAFITQGAAWLALKAPIGSAVHQRATSMRSLFHIIQLVCFVIVSIFFFVFVLPTFVDRPGMVFAYIFAIICALGWVVARLFIAKKNDLLSFLAVNVTPVALIGITASSLFPNLIPAAANPKGVVTYPIVPGMDIPADSLTIFNSANSELCLLAMTIITCIGLPLVLTYHVIIYRTFRGRIKESELEY